MGTTLVQELEWMFQHITQNLVMALKHKSQAKAKMMCPLANYHIIELSH
jgi:hypothetical protein